ncbi:hypothetical protein CSUI_004953, partial [Cystoisospora suis]
MARKSTLLAWFSLILIGGICLGTIATAEESRDDTEEAAAEPVGDSSADDDDAEEDDEGEDDSDGDEQADLP